MATLARGAHVVIIGGGAVGTSIAYHLVKRGISDVAILERDRIGGGSTARSVGGVRLQFPLPQEVRFSLFSLDFFEHFEEELGRVPDFKQVGYLFLLTDPQTLPSYRALLDMQRSQGANVLWLASDEVHALVPDLASDGVIAGTFCPDEGYLGPNEVVQGYTARAREGGAQVYEGVTVTGIEVRGGRASAVETSLGRIEADVVVNAAGPWARPIGQLAGLTIPVFPRHRHVFVTDPVPGLRHPLPMIIDRGTVFHCRSEMEAVLMSPGDVGAQTEYETPSLNWTMVEKTVERAVRWLPALAGAGVASGWVGLRPLTPDEHAIIDSSPIDGLLLAVGLCGHGVQHSPATGKAVSELIIDGKCSSFDLEPFRFMRFQPDATIPGDPKAEVD
jgi:sarcosine oxidase subunit beta